MQCDTVGRFNARSPFLAEVSCVSRDAFSAVREFLSPSRPASTSASLTAVRFRRSCTARATRLWGAHPRTLADAAHQAPGIRTSFKLHHGDCTRSGSMPGSSHDPESSEFSLHFLLYFPFASFHYAFPLPGSRPLHGPD